MEQTSEQMRPIPRWHLRLNSFSKALSLLEEGGAKMIDTGLSQLEREGFTRRFNFTFDFYWMLMKDYMEAKSIWQGGVIIPASVIRAAFAAELIPDADIFFVALEARNALAHTYDGNLLEPISEAIVSRFLPAFRTLHATMQTLYAEDSRS